MSQEQAMMFIERMKTDEAFREAVIKIENVEKKIAFINQEGIRFTSEELMFAAVSALMTE
jgi:predicted ribosomally synthesized peptide with nif11-like leader